jgi:MFS family permease
VYTAFTAVALLATYFILSRRTIEKAIADAKAGREREKAAKQTNTKNTGAQEETAQQTGLETPQPESGTFLDKVGNWLKNHPLANAKFSFFIFCLIPVQTLFAHNWLTLPMYVERAYVESWPWISKNFEPAVNFNPLLIFIFVPIVTAITQKANVYKMMILGTFVMAVPTFLLAIGPHWWTLLTFLVIMTIGEAMWQPRFLQYAAEIAPEGRTGAYMGVAQLPWFLTKMVVPIYSGLFLQNYCPEGGPENTQPMWIIYGCIAISSTVMLILAKPWVGKDFKTKAD